MKRRDFLRKTAANAAAVSTLSGLQGVNWAANHNASSIQPNRKVKYLFVVEGNGLPQRQIHPADVPFIHLNQRDEYREFKFRQLPPSLEPVADHIRDMCIVQGISARVCGGGHSNDHGTLGSYNARDGKLISGPTIDYLLGKERGRIFENVVLGINGKNLDIAFNLSAAGPDKPIATICNPLSAYNRLFGALGNPKDIDADEKVLNFLKEDIKQNRDYMGENQKLNIYENALDNILNRNNLIRKMQGVSLPELSEKYYSTDHVEMLDAHFELAAGALKSGLTDSATVAVGVGYQHFGIQMNSLEGVQTQRHGLGHANMKHIDPNDPHPTHDEAALVRRYIFELIARTLKEVDNVIVIYTSDAAEKHHSRCHEWPHVIIDTSRTLRTDSRFIYYPQEGKKRHKTLNAFHNTLLRSGGIEMDLFGQTSKSVAKEAQAGILKEIWA